MTELASWWKDAGFSDNSNFWRAQTKRTITHPPDEKPPQDAVTVAIDAATLAWREDHRVELNPLLATIRAASQAERTRAPTGKEELRDRRRAVDQSMRNLGNLIGEAFDVANRSAALAIVDCVIDITSDLPTEQADETGWRALSEVLRSILPRTAQDSANIFTTRAARLIKRTADYIGADDGVERRFEIAARVLRGFRTWASPSEFSALVSVGDSVVDKLTTGLIPSDRLQRSSGFISEIVLGHIPAADPEVRFDRLQYILKGAPSAEGVKYVVRRVAREIVNQTLAEAVGQAERADFAAAMQTYRNLSAAVGKFSDYAGGDVKSLQRQFELGRIVTQVCATNDVRTALSDLGAASTIDASTDTNAELAIDRALVARGFLSEARERLTRLSARIDQTIDDPGKRDTKANTARLLGVSFLEEGKVDEAAIQFSKAWDTLGSYIAEQDQLSFAHVLLSIGKPAFAVELVRRLRQKGPSQLMPGIALALNGPPAELAFLDARIHLSQGDAKGALALIGESRRARSAPSLLLPLLEQGLDDGHSQRQGVLSALGASRAVDTRPWRGSPDLPISMIAQAAPPSRPLENALAAAVAVLASDGTLSEDQQHIVTVELRSATRSPTSIAFARADAFASVSDERGREFLRRLILQERTRRYGLLQRSFFDETFDTFGEWPPRSNSLDSYLSAHAPCEGGTEPPLPIRQRSIESLAKQLTPVRNPFEKPAESGISALSKELKPNILTNPESFDVPELREHEAAIVITGSGRTVYTTVIRAGGMAIHRAEFESTDPDIDVLVREALYAIVNRPGKALQANSQLLTLSRLVLWPALRDLDGISSLITVTRGPLAGLPIHLLKLPGSAGKDAEWLDTRFSTRVLPGLDSLYPSVFLNRPNHAVTDSDPKFFAVADPANLGTREECRANPAVKLRTADGYLDPTKFRTLCSIPETRETARVLNRLVGAKPFPESDWMRAGEEAREPDVVGDERLANAHIILFATHGLVAGDMLKKAGVAEPALVLSPPVNEEKPEDWKDGLLTATEIAALNLKADWVVLVACDSASGDGTPNGEALSGLADAFLAAGARGVIVSHWELEPFVSRGLVIKLFEVWDGGKRRMEDALVIAMQAQRSGLIRPGLAQQTEYNWAPFVVVSR